MSVLGAQCCLQQTMPVMQARSAASLLPLFVAVDCKLQAKCLFNLVHWHPCFQGIRGQLEGAAADLGPSLQVCAAAALQGLQSAIDGAAVHPSLHPGKPVSGTAQHLACLAQSILFSAPSPDFRMHGHITKWACTALSQTLHTLRISLHIHRLPMLPLQHISAWGVIDRLCLSHNSVSD